MERLKNSMELDNLRKSILEGRDTTKVIVTICGGTGCSAWGSEAVREAFIGEIKKRGLEGKVEIKKTGCHGFCERGPVVVILPQEIFYQQMVPDDVSEVITETIINNNIIGRLLYSDPITGRKCIYDYEVPFYKKQMRIVLGDNGRIDPTDISDYIARDGYKALEKVLGQMSPDEVIETVENSGLRGRGGAGFPTGKKWRFTKQASNNEKYIICNADEGDPGAFMDRSVLEGNPHSVIEGMIIAAYAIGAKVGYIYVRAEYPLAVNHLRIAISEATGLGLLGKNILNSGFDFEIRIKEGAGAFVCGEETGLIASIEGRRGMPRSRPPFPANSGLDGKPTNINNVETFANIRSIILKGAEWYSNLGTQGSKGTKIFSLTGRINNTGLVEVPMGATLREIIFDIGGGIPKGRKFKAVQMGGPSGGCIPARYLDLPIDYESLKAVGSMMGSGGMIVMDENTCMVDLARFFLNFTQSESCGKCTPCRLGTKQMLEILTRITKGEGREGDIEMLLKIAMVVKDTALCGLGQTCPNPVLSTINNFRNEYEAHIIEKKCPAAVCDALVISPCQHTCPVGVDIPNYIAYIADGKYYEAVELIRERNPFPAICGRICHHPCELKCRRGELDEPLSIRALKRFVADWYFKHITDAPEPFPVTKDERVAIIGAGPAGLSCAYFLRKMGYRVTVFEALPVGGGMLGVAIPDFRLPKEILQKEIEYIVQRGVEIKYNTPLNINFTIDDLRKEGYSAIFIAAGSQKSQEIGIPGEVDGLEGLYYGLRFLRDIKIGKTVKIGKRVAAIGGGNTAMDVARTALRLGAHEVNVFYRRTREEMPVTQLEYKEALEEGVNFNFLVSPTRIVSKDWRVKGLECIRMTLGEVDESGRRRPISIEGSEFFIEADTVIPSVGQAPDLSFLPPDSKFERARWGALEVDKNTLSTNIPVIFAGGDFVTGPTNIIEAIAAGKRGSIAINKYLQGDTSRVEIRDEKKEILHKFSGQDAEEIEFKPRLKVPVIPPEERKKGFDEIEIGFSEEKAKEEAKRCLRCDMER
ncbi:MAG: NADH-quinone oxidoreductase subunit NuoF [Spirochaetes bacterium]|nr:MAG: NADH-quinone oxidoreductase subunit NuoF [Spirochaetota bacterium]